MIVVTILALVVLGFVGKLIYDVQQNKKKPTQNEDGFDVLKQNKCGCGRSETGFCTGLHRISKKDWADGVRNIPAEKPKRKYTKKPKV
jgi:CDGSH-type Zn-finger protein